MRVEKNEFGKIIFLEFSPGEDLNDDEARRIAEALDEQGLRDVVKKFGLKKVVVNGWIVPPKVEINIKDKMLTINENGATLQRNVVEQITKFSKVVELAEGNAVVSIVGVPAGDKASVFKPERIVVGDYCISLSEGVIYSPKKTDPFVRKLRSIFKGFKVEKMEKASVE